MDLGFETIGNACIICHDQGPLLACDPWIKGSAYFGSWSLSHTVPDQQLEAIKSAKFIWLSHGHPDHLSPDSLELLRGKPILIGDHYGGRIAQGLRDDGWEVRVLETGVWTPLSERVRVMCVPDYSQDSMLLIDFDGKLLIDANDAADRGVGDKLRAEVARFDETFLACLTGYGDADMINVFHEDGTRVAPEAAKKTPVGPQILEILGAYGIRTFVPSSSMHKYQRADSVWTNEFKTPPSDHALGFESDVHAILPPFVRFDLKADQYTEINPDPKPDLALPPEDFGDNWSDELEPAEVEEATNYFRRFTHLEKHLGFVNLRVGGKDNFIDIARDKFETGITFETPRASLMTCVKYGVFDDLLIGNFTKATFHGPWERTGAGAFYPHFTPFVTKYGDNGGAYTPEELKAYYRFYADKGFSGPGPVPLTQEAWASLEEYGKA